MTRARYRIAKAIATPPGSCVVWIEDSCTGMSVTNDAENVVRELQREFPGYRIIYRDTVGQWDELLHERGRFIGFAPAADMNPEAAA